MAEKSVSVKALRQQNRLQFLKGCLFVSAIFLLVIIGYVLVGYIGNRVVDLLPFNPFVIDFEIVRPYVGMGVIALGFAFSIFVWHRQKKVFWVAQLLAHLSLASLYISFGLAIIWPRSVLGWLYWIAICGNFAFYIITFVAASLLNPPYYRAIVNHLNAGNYDRALEFVEKSFQKKPDSWKTYHARAAIYCSMGEWEKAESDARRVIQLRPQEQTAYEFLGCALISRGEYLEAKTVLEKAVEISSKSDSMTMLGKAHYRLGEYAAAVKDFELALQKRLEPKSRYLTVTYYLAFSLEKIGETSRAQAAYQKMAQYKQTLPDLKGLWSDKTYVEAKLMQADIADIERRIAAL